MNRQAVAFVGFMGIVLGHLGEHFIQAYQFFVMGWSRSEAMGLLGMRFHWLMMNEWLHYGFAIVMLVGLWAFRRKYTGIAGKWWTVALVLQFWHHFEHAILLYQMQTQQFWFGGSVQTSVGQIWIPRLELHIIYNVLVFVPMVAAMYYARRKPAYANIMRDETRLITARVALAEG